MGAQSLDPQNPQESSQSGATTANVHSTHQATGGGGAAGGGITMSTRISSLAALKKQAPKLYKQMMLGIATNICAEMQKGQDRIHKIMVEARANDGTTGGL